jgi:hypothetical protein
MNPDNATRRVGDAATRRYFVPFLLPVRKQFAPLQMIKAWCQQLWLRWRTPPLRVQPPLQPGRHKPFPQRPHQRRRQAVFAALDAAPVGLTRRQLIAHVRAVTGIGCSEKLITQWRQERCGDAEKGRHGDVGRQRVVQLRLFLVWLLLGATMKPWHPVAVGAAQEITISPAPSATPSLPNFPSPISNPAAPRLLRLQLTLSSPRELLVQMGQQVAAQQLLCDRASLRQRLQLQHRALRSALQHLQTQQQLTAASLRRLQSLGMNLPSVTFAVEQSALQRAEAAAQSAQRAVEIQRQRITSFASLISGEADALFSRNAKLETRNLIVAHETARLTQAQESQALAQAEAAFQRAQLEAARAARVYDEKKHRIDLTRQVLAVRSQQQQAAIEQARLTTQLAEVELQLAQSTAVRAPFTGTIKRIEWEDMKDEKLAVLVYLSIGSR